jgi:uncharacterized LabA/DUF88 family protein
MDLNGTPPRRNVAVFLDLENLYGGASGNAASVPIAAVVTEIERLVRQSGVGSLTAVARAYANWGRSDMAGYRRQMLSNGIEPVQIFSFNHDVKNAADIELVVDALQVAAESPWIDVFVLVSGDGGYIPLIRRLHALGKYVIVVSTSGAGVGTVNGFLRAAADQFHVIQVPDAPGRAGVTPPSQAAAAKAPPTKAPAVPAKTPAPTTTTPTTPAAGPDGAASPRPPSFADYREAIVSLVRADPELLIDGQVNGARLGMLLRKRWPDTTSRSFQHRTLGSFVEEHCGLRMIRASDAKADKELAPV